ncbi:MAG: galactose mutarotase [Clostridia bacterium]|nr:galactose mutarotase [Clostridia bacterium]
MTKIIQSEFGVLPDGRTVYAYKMQEESGAYVTILNYGGVIQSIVVPDKNGKLKDVVLGYDDVDGYLKNSGYLSALIGRFGNRIEKGNLTIDGTTYSLYTNDRGNHLHGGKKGFDKQIWDVKIDGEKLVLHYFSADGEENYPGNLDVTVVYTFKDATLTLDYTAVSDKKTAINLTNHAYFNMNGEGQGTVLTQELYLNAPWMTPTDSTMIPHGEFRVVKDTPFDFNTPKTVGEGDAYKDADPDLKFGKGFDHCFVFAKDRNKSEPYATLYSKETGIEMLCFTDLPAVQFYAGCGLNAVGKGGKQYVRAGGLCLETQCIPNNVNVPAYADFGSSIYDAGKVYHFTSSYQFTVKK